MTFLAPRLLVVLFVALLGASCVTTPPTQSLPDLTFSHLKPLTLAVGSVSVASEYTPSYATGSVEASVPVPPTRALTLWANSRLVAGGGAGTARLIIKTASMMETPLKMTAGIKGAFIKDQSARYEVVVKAELRIYEGGASSAGVAVAQASHTRTVSEDASINDRRRVQFELIEAVMADFDREMEKNARAYLARWLK